jgi:hypothetical protein
MKKIYLIVFLMTFLVGSAFPQSIISSGNSTSKRTNKSQRDFVSLEGEFTINLPSNISGLNSLEPMEGIRKEGLELTWIVPEGKFEVGFYNRIESSQNAKQVLEGAAARVTDILLNYGGGKLISKKEIKFNENLGLEFRIGFVDFSTKLLRFYLVKDKIYTLSTSWEKDKDEIVQLKILDSFRLVDGKALLAKKVEESTPKLLPQSPVIKKLTTDAQDDGLKGKVKSLSLSNEDLSGNWSVSEKKLSVEDFYDENGNKIKHLFYDYRGYPLEISVYGFLDGMRVSSYKMFESDDSPNITVAIGSADKTDTVKKVPDTRYTTKYEYKYDTQRRLKEIILYRNDGDIYIRNVHSYSENKIEKDSFDDNGKLTYKSVETYDIKANLIEDIITRPNPPYSSTTYKYQYEAFDKQGNWTKRIVSGTGAGSKEQHYIEYRTITYYS